MNTSCPHPAGSFSKLRFERGPHADSAVPAFGLMFQRNVPLTVVPAARTVG
jgi:hypothetical protein